VYKCDPRVTNVSSHRGVDLAAQLVAEILDRVVH
jgi:hypothetical protein